MCKSRATQSRVSVGTRKPIERSAVAATTDQPIERSAAVVARRCAYTGGRVKVRGSYPYPYALPLPLPLPLRPLPLRPLPLQPLPLPLTCAYAGVNTGAAARSTAFGGWVSPLG